MNGSLGKVGIVFCGGFPNVTWGLGAGKQLLTWFEEHHLAPDYIIGVSSGCIPAIVMACGKEEMRKMEKVVCEILKPSNIIEWKISKLSWKGMSLLYSNEPLRETLEKYINLDLLFSNAATPLEIVTTMFSRNEGGKARYHSNKDVFHKRDFITEAMDSMAQAPFLAPQPVAGYGLLGDGAYTDPLPIERAIDMGCDTVFVVDIHGHRWIYNEPQNWIDLMILAYHASINRIYVMVHDWVGRMNTYLEHFETMKQEIAAIISNEEERKKVMASLERNRMELFGKVRSIKRHIITGNADFNLKYTEFTSKEMRNLYNLGEEAARKCLENIQI